MKAVHFITIFVVHVIILLLGIACMLVSELGTIYEVSPINKTTVNLVFMISGAAIVISLFGIINFLLGGIIIYYCFNRKYSWLYCLIKNNSEYKSYDKVTIAA